MTENEKVENFLVIYSENIKLKEKLKVLERKISELKLKSTSTLV